MLNDDLNHFLLLSLSPDQQLAPTDRSIDQSRLKTDPRKLSRPDEWMEMDMDKVDGKTS